jgi:hypothetical protein
MKPTYGIGSPGCPLNFGDHSARFGSSFLFEGEIGVEPANLVRGSLDWPPEQILDFLVRTVSGHAADRSRFG